MNSLKQNFFLYYLLLVPFFSLVKKNTHMKEGLGTINHRLQLPVQIQ
jgi:hypothetical protein